MGKKKKVRKKKKFSFKIFFLFLLFEFVFSAATGPLIVFYGPFENVKKTIVGAAMSTLSHQYIATTFLSDQKIKDILKGDVIEEINQNENLQDLEFDNKHDPNIERYDIEGKKFKGSMLVIHDPTRVKVGYSSKIPKSGELTSQIAKANNAVAAVNGGGFVDQSNDGNWTGTGGQPVGLLMSNGKVIRNDITNRDAKNDTVALTSKGVLLVGKYTLNELEQLKVTEAMTFGPALVVNGQPTIKNGDGGWGIAPRTAIGQRKEDGAILLLVIDGRQVSSMGATLKDVQDIMLEYGAYNATNLDGGSSSTMYYDEEVINNPCDPLGERSVPSIIYVTP